MTNFGYLFGSGRDKSWRHKPLNPQSAPPESRNPRDNHRFYLRKTFGKIFVETIHIITSTNFKMSLLLTPVTTNVQF